jgi:hypothetical protein
MVGSGVGVSEGGGVVVPGPEGVGSPGVEVSLGGWEPPGAVVPPGDPLGGWLGSGVGVSHRVGVGDRASPVGGVGVAEAESGVLGHAEAGDSSAPPATTCVPSSDTGMAQPRDVLDGLPASGA